MYPYKIDTTSIVQNGKTGLKTTDSKKSTLLKVERVGLPTSHSRFAHAGWTAGNLGAINDLCKTGNFAHLIM